MKIQCSRLDSHPPDQLPVEIVERKGRGHPDTICDALAEAFSIALSRFYLDRFGAILHHNVDKAMLRAGRACPAFGGGEIESPMEVFLCGRAVERWGGVRVPIEEIAQRCVRDWFRENLHAVDPVEHVRVHCLLRPGSPDLVGLFHRAGADAALANDTSCGVGYAPFSELERVVLETERCLTNDEIAKKHPEIGEDVKVMGMRNGDRIHLTVACALIGSRISGLAEYLSAKEDIADLARSVAQEITARPVAVSVNAADDPSSDSVYLTVTGTSAEGGDDGQSGRGNRVGGLIAPCRPMSLECAAGKNPVNHVGKLYSLAAWKIAHETVETVPLVREAQCFLLSRIGTPINRPQLAHVRVRMGGDQTMESWRSDIETIAEQQMRSLGDLRCELLEGKAVLF